MMRKYTLTPCMIMSGLVLGIGSLMLSAKVLFFQGNNEEPCTLLQHTSDRADGAIGGTAPSSLPPTQDDVRTLWNGVEVEAVGNKLVKKGTSFFANLRQILLTKQSDGTSLFHQFLEVYKRRPDKHNRCGIRLNHALGLYLTVRYLLPSLVVESGVNAGQSTYFIRNAAPDTKILALDPLEKPICGQKERWKDASGKTEYLTGAAFKDVSDIDWSAMINRHALDVNRVLVFLDDHQMFLKKRVLPLQKAGIRHVLMEDNYAPGRGATSADKAGFAPKQLFAKDTLDSRWLFNNVDSYSEFPPIVPSSMASQWNGTKKKFGGFMVASDTNVDTKEPWLRPDIRELDMKLYKDVTDLLGIDPTLKDDDSYQQIMNYNFLCYLKLTPMAPAIRELVTFKSP